MNYVAHYDRLINRARGRDLNGYSERHHVLPKCLGGTDAEGNIVRLTAEEHYTAHLLLVKMHPGHHGLLWAVNAMGTGNGRQRGRNNKRYGWARRLFAESVRRNQTGRKASAETRAKLSVARAGKPRAPHSEEMRAKMSAAAKGRPKSAAHRAEMSKSRLGNRRALGHVLSAEARQKISTAVRAAAWVAPPEYREAQRQNMKRIWAERKATKVGV